jgi:hypothetical protein
MSPLSRFPRSVSYLSRLASVFALLGLGSFAVGLFVPKPLPVIFSMSIGHGFGMIAVLLYIVAIAIDTGRAAPADGQSLIPRRPKAAPVSPEPGTSRPDGERGA